MKRMVIKSSEWHRGGNVNECEFSALLTPEGMRCCIGIHGRLCGIPDAHILSCVDVSSMQEDDITECYKPWLGTYGDIINCHNATANSAIANNAMLINDAGNTTDEQKITALRPIFAEIGVSIVWRPDL